MTHPKSAWHDLTLPIAPDSVAWGGVPSPRLSFLARIDAGAAVNVGRLDCCLHTGTHADAPLHVTPGGDAVDRLDPDLFIGPALVVRTDDPESVTVDALRAAGIDGRGPASDAGPPARVLIATPRQYDGVRFPDTIPHLTPAAARYLAERGVRLVGVNVPSLDPLDSKTMDAHKVVFAAGMGVLENLDLRGIAPGWYDLVAVPIRVAGADAAPVRAVARWREVGGR